MDPRDSDGPDSEAATRIMMPPPMPGACCALGPGPDRLGRRGRRRRPLRVAHRRSAVEPGEPPGPDAGARCRSPSRPRSSGTHATLAVVRLGAGPGFGARPGRRHPCAGASAARVIRRMRSFVFPGRNQGTRRRRGPGAQPDDDSIGVFQVGCRWPLGQIKMESR